MLRVEYAFYLLPPRRPAGPRAKPYQSRFKMTAEEAKALGAVGQVRGSVEVRLMPETEAERLNAQFHYQSAGRDGAQPPPKE
jgi:hypothetical protein